MNKYQTFEDLQSLGTEKIHEKTHISRDKLELILTKSYGDIGQVQFMGFMSILEREFGIDLSDVRLEYMDYRQQYAPTLPPKQSVILQPQSNTKQKWIVAGIVLIALLLGGGYFLQGILSNEPREEVMNLSSLVIDPVVLAHEENASAADESNATAESNLTAESNQATVTGETGITGMTIRPIYAVWAGMIEMETGAKTQQVTKEPISVDTTKNWLIVLGHGHVEIETAEGKQVLKEKETVRFVYENGSLKQLSRAEFMERNGGKNW